MLEPEASGGKQVITFLFYSACVTKSALQGGLDVVQDKTSSCRQRPATGTAPPCTPDPVTEGPQSNRSSGSPGDRRDGWAPTGSAALVLPGHLGLRFPKQETLLCPTKPQRRPDPQLSRLRDHSLSGTSAPFSGQRRTVGRPHNQRVVWTWPAPSRSDVSLLQLLRARCCPPGGPSLP